MTVQCVRLVVDSVIDGGYKDCLLSMLSGHTVFTFSLVEHTAVLLDCRLRHRGLRQDLLLDTVTTPHSKCSGRPEQDLLLDTVTDYTAQQMFRETRAGPAAGHGD